MRSTTVRVIDKDTGKLVKTYPSITACAKDLGCSRLAVREGLRNTGVGMVKGTILCRTDPPRVYQKRVRVLNIYTGQLTFYPSIRACARAVRVSKSYLSLHLIKGSHRMDGLVLTVV